MYNLMIGGAAGQGIDTTTAILERLLRRAGYFVFTTRDFMSRIRGGHNFSLLRFGAAEIGSHSMALDGLIAVNDETVELHLDELKPDGFILCDSGLKTTDPRAIKLDMNQMAKDIGNPKVSGNIGLGAVLKLFGLDISGVTEVLKLFLKESLIDINVQAVKAGYDSVDTRFQLEPGDFGDCMTISGSTALGLGAIAAGVKLYAAYPMSPSTPIMVYLASQSEKAGLVVEQAEDEIAAINMAIGASFAGARAMTGTSGGGFSLMVEALGLAGIAEVPVVVVDVMRPGPATGFPTRTEQGDLKFVVSASQGEFPRMVIALRNHTDAFYQTHRALNLAEKYQMPVIILSDQYLGDATSTVAPYDVSDLQTVRPADDAGEYLRYQVTDSGISPRLLPGKTKHLVLADSDEHDERGWITESADVRVAMVDKRMRKLEGLRGELIEPAFMGPEAFDTLLVGWGSTYGAIKEAVALLNESSEKYAALVFGDIWPLPTKLLKEKAAVSSRVINVEQNATGQLASLIREETGLVCDGHILKYDGRQISGEEIAARIREEVQG